MEYSFIILFVTSFLARTNCLVEYEYGDGENDLYEKETLKSVFMQDPYKLKADEEWPEEVAHLFGNKREGEDVKEEEPKKKPRKKRWTEWVSKKLEFREDSWDEPPQKQKPEDDEKFVAYENNGTYIMSRCSSPKGALTLVLACPQPRGSSFHRIVDLQHAIYGWSQHESDVCQYVEGDCTIRYEFVHKQIMRPTTPQNMDEWKSLGPQYFCNSWEGNGRLSWEMPQKRWCAVGLKRSSQSPNVGDPVVNAWGTKYLYAWNSCGGSYDWFDYLHIEYKCQDVMESIAPQATRPYHYRPVPECIKKGPPPPTPPAPTNATTEEDDNEIEK